MKKDYSYGIVPIYINKDGEKEFLVIHQKTKNGSFWGFPKGHAEKGETEIESAKRELFEEVGIYEININEGKTFETKYSFKEDGEIINKTVKYWIGYVKDKNVKIQNEELNDCERLDYENMLHKLTHDNTRNEIKKVFNKN